MTRSILATATLIGAMTLFTSAAQACISCEYVPEVLHASKSPATHSYTARSYTRERSYSAALELKARRAQERAIRNKLAAKKIEAASAAPVKAQPKKEAPVATAAPVKTQTVAENTDTGSKPAAQTQTETSKQTSTTALLTTKDTPPVEEPAAAGPVTCKKFLPAVGVTLTVDCPR